VDRPGDTKQRIQLAARELFAQKGVHKTSLKEIADRLGISKPALYYHFGSREELVRSIVQPLIDAGEAFLLEQEALDDVDPRKLLEGYFDFNYAHRDETVLILTELTTLNELGLVEVVIAWRERLAELLCGKRLTLDKSVRAVLALGGIQDCTIQFPDVPAARLRRASVDAACAALGISA
jgi:AcrR family transcriptional regulator